MPAREWILLGDAKNVLGRTDRAWPDRTPADDFARLVRAATSRRTTSRLRHMMKLWAPRIVVGAWIVFLLYWAATARDVKTTQWQESPRSAVIHRTLLAIAAILLGARWNDAGFLTQPVLPLSTILVAMGVALVVIGVAFAIWARRTLGSNWSAAVTVKEGHTLVRTGPYKVVRHPIYTGMLIGFLGTAMVIDETRGVLAIVLATAAFVYKSRVEEHRMQATFPAYDDYRRHSAALVPFIY